MLRYAPRVTAEAPASHFQRLGQEPCIDKVCGAASAATEEAARGPACEGGPGFLERELSFRQPES